jgi:hypothetical protein
MANNQINLGKIDYDQITESLTNFLKSQETLKDYNFRGSVIQSVVSLLAYNTLYYALYSNMLANEMFLDTAQREESVVSLLKPLGVLVPTKTSARVRINLGGASILPRYDQFYGKNNDGVIYNFYSMEEYIPSGEDQDFIQNIVLVEGKELVKQKDITGSFNYDTQTYFLGNREIDVSTIIVEVDSGDGIFKEWIRTSNIGSSTDTLSQNIYFIERFDNGFELQFGKDNSLGNTILDTYKIRVSYLVSSGSAANDIVVFTKTTIAPGQNITVVVLEGEESSGGLDSPNLDYYKFIGPKYFASQNRAVTKDDFLVISTEYLKSKGYDVTKDNFNIFGGDEIYPPKYGRVFIATDAVQTPDILDLVAYLKTKCTLTVLPEYVTSNTETIPYNVRVTFKNNNLTSFEKRIILTNLRNYLITNYSFINSYNINFSGVESDVLLKYLELQSCSISLKFIRTYNGTPQGGIIINLENELDIDQGVETSITDPFVDSSGNNVILKAFASSPSERSQLRTLRTYVRNSSGVYVLNTSLNYGSINISQGYIKLNNITSSPFLVNVNLKNSDFVSSQNTRFSVVPDTVLEL